MSLRAQILFSILGITFLSQAVFGLLSYRQINESRGDQLTIFLQVVNRQAAEYLTLTDDPYVVEIYLEELRKKFSTPESILIIQENNNILYIAGNQDQDVSVISQRLNEAYADSTKHGLIEIGSIQYYWAVSQLPDNNYQLVMLQPAANEEKEIASTIRLRLISFGFIIFWIAVWISLLLSAKISRKLDEQNEQLEHIALHDSLTGLPNRKLLIDRLEQELLQAQRRKQHFALFLIDLDKFKEINDNLGHQFGDELLKIVSSRLSASVRGVDSVARLGGDEFSVLLPQTDLTGAELCARRILQAMEAPFCINDISTECRASIGITIYPDDGGSADVLMQYADAAMYQAKKSQAGYALYDPAKNTHSVRRMQLMHDLRDAIGKNEINVYYQPLMESMQLEVVGVEVLARWQHPELGDVPPDEFIPMVEQMGLIRLLSLQILEQAISDCSNWKAKGYHLGLNVNISTSCLQDSSFPEKINDIIQNYNIDASNVELEISETSIVRDLGRAEKVLDQLRDTGVRLAIDKFGTGFTSLDYLKNLSVDTLKIDKLFISDMCSNKDDYAIVKSIIELGHNLGRCVAAEGVENQRTLDALRLLNVDIIQGFFYNKPQSSDNFIGWLIDYNEQAKMGKKN
jgi:diguanylate cyclase (GGDEF)-like protein